MTEVDCQRCGSGFKTTADDILSRLPDQRNEAQEGTMVALRTPRGNWFVGRVRYSGARMPKLGISTSEESWIDLNSAVKIIRI